MPTTPAARPTALVTIPAMANPRRVPVSRDLASPGIDRARPTIAVISPRTAMNGIQAMATATMPQTIPATARPLPRDWSDVAGGRGSTKRRPPDATSAVHSWSLW